MASVFPLLLSGLQAENNKLLPFQGRLTDASGNPVADGAKVVQFQMYDAPTGGNVKWAGEVQKLSINGGLVNTLLGTKANLSGVDFGTPVYLQITVDANGDGSITAADPPLLPRQSVVPAVYAAETDSARGLEWVNAAGARQGTANWSALFGAGNNPATAAIQGSRLADASVPAGKLTADGGFTDAYLADNSVKAAELADNSVDSGAIIDGSVGTNKLAAGSVTSSKIGDGQVSTAQLANGAVTWDKLAGRSMSASGVTAPLGGIAQGVLAPATYSIPGSGSATAWNNIPVTATLITRGRPVFVGLVPTPPPGILLPPTPPPSHIKTEGSATNGSRVSCRLIRNAGSILTEVPLTLVTLQYSDSQANATRTLEVPPGVIWTIDTPGAGTHRYDFQIHANSAEAEVTSLRLIAFEL